MMAASNVSVFLFGNPVPLQQVYSRGAGFSVLLRSYFTFVTVRLTRGHKLIICRSNSLITAKLDVYLWIPLTTANRRDCHDLKIWWLLWHDHGFTHSCPAHYRCLCCLHHFLCSPSSSTSSSTARTERVADHRLSIWPTYRVRMVVLGRLSEVWCVDLWSIVSNHSIDEFLVGPVSSTTILGKDIVILNTLDACVELLEKRSSIYSGRPRMPFAGELYVFHGTPKWLAHTSRVGWDQQLVFSPYNRHFRAMRKLAQNQLGTKVAASKYYDIIEVETKHLILRLYQEPEGLAKHIRT